MSEATHARFNACYNALDMQVVRGSADDPALVDEAGDRAYTFAELLAEVAALAGVLRVMGVGAGDRVGVPAVLSPETVIAIRACARLGAVDVAHDADDALAGETAVALVARPEARPVLIADRQEIEWDVAMRAGRTDPAAVVAVTPGDQASRLAATGQVFAPLLAGAAITLSEG